MNKVNAINFIKRSISTSSQLNGKRNFRKFLLYNKRGTREFKERQRTHPHPDIPIQKRGVKDTGYLVPDFDPRATNYPHLEDKLGKFRDAIRVFPSRGTYVEVPEMIPQLIVPDLTGCAFKPYVSYRTPDVIQSEFTSEDLFNAVYGKKIVEDFRSGKLKEDGSPEEPSENELLDAETAFIRARQTGSDIFDAMELTPGLVDDPK